VTERRLRLAIAVLTLGGATVASYLVYTRYTGARLLCVTGGCETVQKSSYAELIGVPVAVLGLLLFVVLLATAAVPGPVAAAVGATLALGGALFAGYLLVVQVQVIHAVCQWCVASDVLVIVVAVLAVARLRIEGPVPRVREST
jgi:uncharacterized membrane protein